jgi:hypothetical protein
MHRHARGNCRVGVTWAYRGFDAAEAFAIADRRFPAEPTIACVPGPYLKAAIPARVLASRKIRNRLARPSPLGRSLQPCRELYSSGGVSAAVTQMFTLTPGIFPFHAIESRYSPLPWRRARGTAPLTFLIAGHQSSFARPSCGPGSNKDPHGDGAWRWCPRLLEKMNRSRQCNLSCFIRIRRENRRPRCLATGRKLSAVRCRTEGAAASD